jgi:hypothetical protein
MRYVNDKRSRSKEIFERRANCKKPFSAVKSRSALAEIIGSGVSVWDAEKILNRGGVIITDEYEIRKSRKAQRVLRNREKRAEAVDKVKAVSKEAGAKLSVGAKEYGAKLSKGAAVLGERVSAGLDRTIDKAKNKGRELVDEYAKKKAEKARRKAKKDF